MAKTKRITMKDIKEFFKGIGTTIKKIVKTDDTPTVTLPPELSNDPINIVKKLYPEKTHTRGRAHVNDIDFSGSTRSTRSAGTSLRRKPASGPDIPDDLSR